MTGQNVYNIDRLYLSITGESVLRKHNGSIFSFIAVALVLVVATGLIVFAINNRSSSDSDVIDEVISQTDTDDKKQSERDDKDEKAPADKEETRKEDSDKATEETPQEETAPVDTRDDKDVAQPETPAPAAPVAPSTPSTSSEPSAEVNTAALPVTGLTQDFLSSAIGILAIVGAGYVYYHFGRNQ